MTRSRDTASIIPTVDAKGDLLVGTADNTIDNLSPGTNGQVLTANSATTTGLEWKAVSATTPVTYNSGTQTIGLTDSFIGQTVRTYASTAARGSAIPSPVIGMTTYLEDIDRLETYNGSIWTSPSDLVLVKSQVSGTGVSTVVVSDAFNADFDNYTIYITGGSTSAGANLSLRFGSTNTGHYEGGYRSSYGAGVITGEFASNGDTIQRAARGSSLGVNGIVEVSQPFATRRTFYSYRGASMSTGDFGWQGSGFLNDSNSYTSFTLIPNVGTITGINITVFGNRRSN